MPTPLEYLDLLAPHQELLLSNALLLGEYPAPSGAEEDRINFVAERFASLQDVSIDPVSYTHLTLPTIYSV